MKKVFNGKEQYKTIHRFIKKCFFTAMTSFSYNVLNVNSLECVSMNNQECKIRPEIINININEPLFYSYSIKINTCKSICNTINDPYAKMCVLDHKKKHKCQSFKELINKRMCDK